MIAAADTLAFSNLVGVARRIQLKWPLLRLIGAMIISVVCYFLLGREIDFVALSLAGCYLIGIFTQLAACPPQMGASGKLISLVFVFVA